MAIGRPAKGIDDVAERLVAAAELLAFEQATALAVGFLKPDVVVFEVILLGFEVSMDGINDAAIGGISKGIDVVINVDERLVEILGAGSGKRAARNRRCSTGRRGG